jgi:RHS repeat-associated protein
VDWLVSQSDAVDGTRSATYAYDKAGNLTDKVKGGAVRQLRWSYRDTLTSVLQGADATQLVEVGRYDYDPGLQRVKRTTAQEQVEYVLDDRHVLQEASAAAGHPAYRRYHYADGPLLVEDGAARRFISTDALGSPTDLTSAGATVASMRKYDAWGQYRNDTAPVASEPKLGFTGHQYDPETGLVYARARYYDPDLGRFISRDTWEGDLADAPSLHRYAYAYDNPLVYVDPDGNAAYEAAEEWERAQREAAWTGEETMEKVQADSARFANWAAEKLGDSWASRIVGGVVVATAQTVIELTGGLAAVITDPTALIRAPLRLGTGAAEGVEKIERGEYVGGTLAIVADAAAAVETAAGAYAFARNVRVTVEQPRAQSRGILEVLDPHDGGARRPGAAASFTAKAPTPPPGSSPPTAQVIADAAEQATAAARRAVPAMPDAGAAVQSPRPPLRPSPTPTVGLSAPSPRALEMHRRVSLKGEFELVEKVDVSTGRNEAVFWSGPGNKARATEYARLHGGSTLEMTPGGKALVNRALGARYGTELAVNSLWYRLSQRFSERARGRVHVFAKGASRKRTFYEIEEPTLRDNPDVTKRTYHY